MSLEVAAISSVVVAAVKYLLASKGLQLAAEQAAEKIGQLGGEALVNAGKNALTKLRAALAERGEAAKKARTALTNLEEDPQDADYQRKLTVELEQLATRDAALRTLLEQLSHEIQQAGGDSGAIEGSVTVTGEGRIYGPAVGINPGTISGGTYTFTDRDTE